MDWSKIYLNDSEFLRALDNYPHKEKYARIISLTQNEEQIEEIQGQVTQGSINIDGKSAVRRSCSLTLVATDVNINDFYWGLNTKFKVEIGLKNFIDPQYPEIVWFSQGVYLITSFSESIQNNSHTINISGKDKMCLLNGEIGGHVMSISHDFGTIDTYDENGIKTNKSILISTIIRDAVHEYGREELDNIIINDVEDTGKMLMEYKGSDPMYYLINRETGEFYREIHIGEPIKIDNPNSVHKEIISINFGDIDIIYNPLLDDLFEVQAPTVVYLDEMPNYTYTIAKYEYGDPAGYKITDLTYNKDLILSVGEPVTSLLDKLVQFLGNFEYFYDIDGHFVFQKQKTYVDSVPNNLRISQDKEEYTVDSVESSAISYSFEGNNLISSFQNSPNLLNLRNDYAIWGTRKSGNTEVPIHLRYAIDNKPTYYHAFDDKIYCTQKELDYAIETVTNSIREEYEVSLSTYKPKYQLPGNLQAPIKNSDGSWSSGWWDVRDWYEYYTLITKIEPNGTLKWYTQNNSEAIVPMKTVLEQLESDKDKFVPNSWDRWAQQVENSNQPIYIWMITIKKNSTDNKFNLGWGHSWGYYSDPPSDPNSTFYTSEIVDGRIKTTKHPDKRMSIARPMQGCSDNHTFLTFMQEDVWDEDFNDTGGGVYLYNPNFNFVTETESFDELINKEISIQVEKIKKQYVVCDWREIIYRMALDYRANFYNGIDFLDTVQKLNGRNSEGEWRYFKGKTGYEEYYTDLEAFWRELYCLKDDYYEVYLENATEWQNALNNYTLYWKTNIKREDGNSYVGYIEADTSEFSMSKKYYRFFDNKVNATPIELNNVKDYMDGDYYLKDTDGNYYKPNSFIPNQLYYENSHPYILNSESNDGWVRIIQDAPQKLNFWFDFLSKDVEMMKYSVHAIGDRTKALNDKEIKAIYFREVPNVLFYENDEDVIKESGFNHLKLEENMKDLFSPSAQGKCAFDQLDNYLYNYAYCIESVNINAIPVYYLQPNTRIFINDTVSGINGEYIISRITLPLDYNGLMSISATRAPERLY